ncbi:DUF397 domain-containing protein [Streptomyces sp. NPDC046866]|uniref:DUF397 domain-containing protein n=1 Tax=Streptomyces sp. NPDC046866 TaxID=3154921 RepID=UPI00345501BB
MNTTLRWRKSSHSSDAGGACVEVAYEWRRSSYSDQSGGACVEVAACPHAVHIRDSKDLGGPTFAVAPAAWADFAAWAAR